MRYFILLMLFSGVVHSGAYKCEVNGKTIFQQSRCADDSRNTFKSEEEEWEKQKLLQQSKEVKIQPKPKSKPLKSASNEHIEKQFSAWDGSHMQLANLLKNNMDDPSSFEHVSTRYWDNGDGTINVFMKYRGKNRFGALILNSVKVKADIDSGVIIGVIQ